MMTHGVDTGYFATHNDLGAAVHDVNMPVNPGTYQVSHITFSITGAAPGVYTFFTTTTTPRPSNVASGLDEFDIPRASFTITVVPEPSTFALSAFAGAVLGLLAYRCRCATR